MLLIGFPDMQNLIQSICQPQRRLHLHQLLFSIYVIFYIGPFIDRTGNFSGWWNLPLVKNVPECKASGFQVFLKKNGVGLFNLEEGILDRLLSLVDQLQQRHLLKNSSSVAKGEQVNGWCWRWDVNDSWQWRQRKENREQKMWEAATII